MMTTKSPVSTWGVKSGRCLPRSRLATVTASRPTTRSVASMTHQLCLTASFLTNVVDTETDLARIFLGRRNEYLIEGRSEVHRRRLGCDSPTAVPVGICDERVPEPALSDFLCFL